jgi:hypothetical protein
MTFTQQTYDYLLSLIKSSDKRARGAISVETDPVFNAWLATNPLASYQPIDQALTDISGIGFVNNDLIYYNGSSLAAIQMSAIGTTAGFELLSHKGAANGYVPLNSSTLIDQVYLPSYVDDILEYANLAAFPATGETGKIYIAISPSNKQYRWTGSAYIAITNGLIGSTSDVPEGTNLYYTDARFDTRFGTKTTSNLAEGSNLYFTNARAIAATLTGYTSGAGTISASDTILSAIQKLNGNIAAFGSPLTNPMTAVGDLIVGSTVVSGAATPTRLAIGANNYFMKSNGTTAAWADLFGTANTWSAKQTFSASAAILLSNTTNGSNHIQSYLSVNSIGHYVNHLYCTDSLGVVKSAIRTTCGNSSAIPYLSFHVGASLTEYFRMNNITGANHSLVKMYFGDGTTTPTALVHVAGSTTSAASLRIVSGTAPTSPNDGDIWFDGTNLKMRIGGTTKTFTIV